MFRFLLSFFFLFPSAPSWTILKVTKLGGVMGIGRESHDSEQIPMAGALRKALPWEKRAAENPGHRRKDPRSYH